MEDYFQVLTAIFKNFRNQEELGLLGKVMYYSTGYPGLKQGKWLTQRIFTNWESSYSLRIGTLGFNLKLPGLENLSQLYNFGSKAKGRKLKGVLEVDL